MREFSTDLSGVNKIEKLGSRSIVKMDPGIVKIDFQMTNLFYLTSKGELYGYGSNKNGVLGLGTLETQGAPVLIKDNIKDFVAYHGVLYILDNEESLWKVGYSNTLRFLRYLNKVAFGSSVENGDPVSDAIEKHNALLKYFKTNAQSPAFVYFKQLVDNLALRKIMTHVKDIAEYKKYVEITDKAGNTKYLAADLDIPLNRKLSESEVSNLFNQRNEVIFASKEEIQEQKDLVEHDRVSTDYSLFIKDNILKITNKDRTMTTSVMDNVSQLVGAFLPILVYTDTDHKLYISSVSTDDQTFKKGYTKDGNFKFMSDSVTFVSEIVDRITQSTGYFTWENSQTSEMMNFVFYRTKENKLYRLSMVMKEYLYDQEDDVYLVTQDLFMENVESVQVYSEKLVIKTTEGKFLIVSSDYHMPKRGFYEELEGGNMDGLVEHTVLFTGKKDLRAYVGD